MTFKRKLGLRLARYGVLFRFARKINIILFQLSNRQHDKSFGPLNPDVKFFVIRGEGANAGLFGLYYNGIEKIYYSLQNGFIPIFDYKNYRTQYNVDFPVNGTYNAWEYYFDQPCSYTLDEVYKSCNVRLSGWTVSPPPSYLITDEMRYKLMQMIPIKKYVRDIADAKILSDDIRSMLGILVRGTDYVSLKPKGHDIPPTAEQAADKLDEFIAKYGERKIFLATEDEKIFEFFTNKYGDLIYTTDKNFIHEYSGNDYLAHEAKNINGYKFGLDYLVKIVCLSECMCLISSKTMGSIFARLLNNGRYVEDYNFDLGVY